MKKVIFGLALFGAIAANAAAIAWNTGTVAKPSEYGTGSAGLKGRGYAFEITKGAYDAWMLQASTESIGAAMASIYAEYGSQTGTPDATMNNGQGSNQFKSGKASFSTSANALETKYYAFVFTYLDSSSPAEVSHYMANVGSVTINEGGNDTALNNVATVFGGTIAATGTTNMGWQSVAVPEPTSGLLLLLGVAGLALKRKRA